MKTNGFIAVCAGLTSFVFLLVFWNPFANGLSLGLANCAKIVIPSLFPFLIAASLTGSGEIPAKAKTILNPITQRLFHLPAESLPVIILSQLGGYLSGAKAAESLYRAGTLNKSQAERLLLFGVNSGIGFSVNAIGTVMLGSRKSGIILLISLCISSLIVGFMTRFLPQKDSEVKKLVSHPPSFSFALVESVSSSAQAMLAACAFVTVFSGLTAVLDSLIKSENLKLAAACLLEVTNGCINTAGKVSLPALAAICAFGGICVHMQVFAVAKSISVKIPLFYLFRFLHSALAFITCRITLYFFPIETQVFLSVSENVRLWSFSAPSSVSLLLLSALLILDLDNKKKIC
ncbi:MAG: hypothetical protein IJ264_08255 [Clostridia bacterium]|nr:hypothetical protein [Clostridia bacterium]